MLHCGDYDMKKRSKAKKPIRGIYKAMESEFKAAIRRKKRAASKSSAKKGDVRRSSGKKHARNPKKSRRGVRGR